MQMLLRYVVGEYPLQMVQQCIDENICCNFEDIKNTHHDPLFFRYNYNCCHEFQLFAFYG
jgi:hypothetical protein